ncbi:hypothetical protein AB833_24130 [Chromatiales bacterium (ex Bugula neritina AB1)]|nr:hypothetical protein AB833_24130 [Chromatiales bacterium (ex Bugula neritina AB1)]
MLKGVTEAGKNGLKMAFSKMDIESPIVSLLTESILMGDNKRFSVAFHEKMNLCEKDIITIDGVEFLYDPVAFKDASGLHLDVDDRGCFQLLGEI